jgi:hypothetical protein
MFAAGIERVLLQGIAELCGSFQVYPYTASTMSIVTLSLLE